MICRFEITLKFIAVIPRTTNMALHFRQQNVQKSAAQGAPVWKCRVRLPVFPVDQGWKLHSHGLWKKGHTLINYWNIFFWHAHYILFFLFHNNLALRLNNFLNKYIKCLYSFHDEKRLWDTQNDVPAITGLDWLGALGWLFRHLWQRRRADAPSLLPTCQWVYRRQITWGAGVWDATLHHNDA